MYITPEEYAIAERNGISRKRLEARIRVDGWEKERAIYTKIRKPKTSKKIRDLAKENGITYQTLMTRINQLGWNQYDAATVPVAKKHSEWRERA